MEEQENVLGIDLCIYNLRQDIINIINTANLPAGIVSFVMRDIIQEVDMLYNQNVQTQLVDYSMKNNQIENKDFKLKDIDTSELSEEAKEKWNDFLNQIDKDKESEEEKAAAAKELEDEVNDAESAAANKD